MCKVLAACMLLWAGGAGLAAADDNARASIGDSRLSAGDEVVFDVPVDGNIFGAGARVEVRERVDRSAYLSGGSVTVSGAIGRNLYAAGGDLRLEGPVEGKVRAAGGKIRVTSTADIAGSASFAGGSIDIDGSIGERLRAFGDSIEINGAVGGDVELAGDRLRIGPDARIAGRVEYRGGGDLVVDPLAVVAGGVAEMQPDRRWLHRAGRSATIFGGITVSFGMVLLGALLILATPRFSREAAAGIRHKPWQSAGLGCAMLVGIPVAIVVLVVTVIGIPLALLLAFGYVALLLLGYLVAAIFVGDTVLERAGREKLDSVWWRALFMFLALLALAVAKAVPLIGGLAVLLLFVAGIGAFTMRSWAGFRDDGAEARPA